MATNSPATNVEVRLPATKVSYLALPHKGQLAILCLARLADPLASTSIQVCGSSRSRKWSLQTDTRQKSYMFYQLRSFDPSASEATISTQAGLLVGAKTAAQVLTGMFWGKLADSELGGRKMVLFIGLMSCCKLWWTPEIQSRTF